MPLAAMLTRLSVAWPWIAAACALLVVVWTLLIVVQLTVKYAPAASRNYLPAQLFLVGAIGIVISGEALASLVAALLLALAMRQFVLSLHKEYRFSQVFHAGFYAGSIPLLYAPAAVPMLVCAVAALAIYRRSVREVVVCFAGLLLPVPAAGFIYRMTGTEWGFIYRELWRCSTEHSAHRWAVPDSAVAVAALVATLAVIGIVWTLTHKKGVRKKQYKFVRHTSIVLLFTAASAAVPGASTSLAPLVAVLCALCVPYAFQGKQAVTSTIVYCLIVAAVSTLGMLPVLGLSIP